MNASQQLIERSFFEAIRLKLVALGWTPDIADTGTYPDTAAGWAAYKAAIQSIVTSKGYAIEVFGASNPDDKGSKSIPRVSLSTEAFAPGDLGYDSSPRLVLDTETNKYKPYSYDSRTYIYFLDIRIAAKTQTQLRELTNVVHSSLPSMGYLPHYNDTAQSFFTEFVLYQNESEARDNILESVYRWQIPDIQWVDIKELDTDPISKVAEITINTKIAEYLGISYTVN